VALAALPLLIACDGGLADRPNLGAPEEWQLGPFEQGEAITVPANPCPAETTSVITAAGFLEQRHPIRDCGQAPNETASIRAAVSSGLLHHSIH
jgi:hypothetical protein